MDQDYVISKDGTRISFLIEGSGPAVLVIPGALTIARQFESFSKELARNFTVFTISRRGREGSGPQGDAYSIARECEDILAVQEKAGAGFIFGHSFGGFVTLETALGCPLIKKIALYEPGISIESSIPMGWAGECQKLLDQGQNLDAFITFIRGINPETSGKLPRWAYKFILPLAMKKDELALKYRLLPGTIREHAEIARRDNTYLEYKEIKAKFLLMYGGRPQNPENQEVMQKLARAFSDKEILPFPKFDHFGPEKHPQAVAEAVTRFFLAE